MFHQDKDLKRIKADIYKNILYKKFSDKEERFISFNPVDFYFKKVKVNYKIGHFEASELQVLREIWN